MTPSSDVVRHVNYFRPFTHYFGSDILRVGIAIVALFLAIVVLRLAHTRWDESRRSASLYLLSIVAFSALFVYAEVHALGHPPTVVLWFLPVPLLLATWASVVVVGEAKAGIWARRA